MSDCTQILVRLRHADPTALTAEGALRGPLGFGQRLARVERWILWELTGPGPEDAPAAIVALGRSGELWNPNKEAALIRAPGEASPLRAEGRSGTPPIWTLAWQPERDLDRSPVAAGFPEGRRWRLARGVLWGLSWTEGEPEEQAHWTDQAVVCSGPRRGLLVHPHIEDHRRIDPAEPAPWLPAPR